MLVALGEGMSEVGEGEPFEVAEDNIEVAEGKRAELANDVATAEVVVTVWKVFVGVSWAMVLCEERRSKRRRDANVG